MVKGVGDAVKRADFYLSILKLLREGKRPSRIIQNKEEGSICAELGLSKQALNYWLSSLKQWGYITRQGKGVWKVLELPSQESLIQKHSKVDSEAGMKPITNLHALEISFPILSGIIQDADWEIKNKLKHWIPKYTKLPILEGLTIRNNNNKSITVFAHSRNLQSLEEVDNLAFQIRSYIHSYFKNKHKVELDVMNCQVKNLNLATEDKPSEGMLRKGEKFELRLNKQAEKVFPKDTIDGKAWIDGSPFKFSAETNDKEWKREYLRMPFAVRDLSHALPLLQEYTRQLQLHMKVQEEQLKTQKATQRLQKKLDESIERLIKTIEDSRK